MARFKTQSSSLVGAVFALGILAGAAVVLVSPGGLAITVAPPPTNNKFLRDCQIKIATCGLEVFNGIFKSAPVSANCCHRLVYMGKTCHDELVKSLISQPLFKGNQAQILASAQRTWDYCFSVPY
ncbi:Prolamin-like domain containing protein [Trema orientale]|uniref:Prolamin-like domain containing protein n=1 Tax=Trema orientale TaxID=63057 RepID=A0A2P5E8J4_TREOI|nr:Prolamin-like domain containing protein [Trema orientale]